MRRDRQIAILRVVLLLVLISIPVLSEMGLFSGRMRINDAFHEGSSWLKLDEIPARSFLSASGATNQYMYFVYEENNATDVDIFDIAGTYQCTFCFSDYNNGTAEIACVDGFVYVYLKNGDVIIFSDTTIIQVLPLQEAQMLGYTYYWFREQPKTMEFDNENINILDHEGNVVLQTQKPNGVSVLALSQSKANIPIWIVYILIVILVACLLAVVRLIVLSLKDHY